MKNDTKIKIIGLGGWTEGLLAEGYEVIGFDIEWWSGCLKQTRKLCNVTATGEKIRCQI